MVFTCAKMASIQSFVSQLIARDMDILSHAISTMRYEADQSIESISIFEDVERSELTRMRQQLITTLSTHSMTIEEMDRYFIKRGKRYTKYLAKFKNF